MRHAQSGRGGRGAAAASAAARRRLQRQRDGMVASAGCVRGAPCRLCGWRPSDATQRRHVARRRAASSSVGAVRYGAARNAPSKTPLGGVSFVKYVWNKLPSLDVGTFIFVREVLGTLIKHTSRQPSFAGELGPNLQPQKTPRTSSHS